MVRPICNVKASEFTTIRLSVAVRNAFSASKSIHEVERAARCLIVGMPHEDECGTEQVRKLSLMCVDTMGFVS